MKKYFYFLIVLLISLVAKAQWTPLAATSKVKNFSGKEKYFSLDLEKIRSTLENLPENGSAEINIPTADGNIEKFIVKSSPVVAGSLATKYKLGSYTGKSVENPAKEIRFSLSPYGFSSTVFSENGLELIDESALGAGVYGLHKKKQNNAKGTFVCSTPESAKSRAEITSLIKSAAASGNALSAKMSDRRFRTLRIAISTTAEYTNYFGGVAQALAAINATLTRVNGIFERDFALQLILQDFPQLIYTNPATDPYSDYTSGANGAWSLELQNNLTNTIGNAAYDLGHLFGANGGGGNAGGVGLVCSNDSSSTSDYNKGSAFTSPADGKPYGDTFDIDYVAHEMGHQLGATHTFSYQLEYQGTSVEPGSGSTIMGYAGITNADVQSNSDPYFHIVSIDQVLSKMQSATCDTESSVGNSPPVIQALGAYTIPKSTAFALTAVATDAENDPLTYNWEQTDDAKSPVTNITGNETYGPIFRSVAPSSSPTRYFPKFSRVLEGSLTNPSDWESVSKVARTLNFSVTVRDNNANPLAQQLNSANQVITVGSDGPFRVTSNQVYTNAATTIYWDTANTASAPYNVSNVKIDYSKDGGTTWFTLMDSTPNDGSESLSFQNAVSVGDAVYIRVSAINNVFYALSKATAVAALSCGALPSGISISNISQNSAQVNWTLISGATYTVRYRLGTSTTWQTLTTGQNFIILNNLQSGISYDVQIAATCSGTTQNYSNVVQFVTLSSLSYCSIATDSSTEEYISSVSLAGITNTSGSSTYSDFSADASKLIKLTPGSANTLSVTVSKKDAASAEAVKAWIDFDGDGLFEDSEVIFTPSISTNTVFTANFTVPADAATGKSVKLRIALRYNNTAITPCTGYDYGEIEDYAVLIQGATVQTYSDVMLYPVPVSDVLTVTNVAQDAPYQLYDMGGRLLASGNLSNNALYVTQLSPGVYILAVDYNGGQIKRKFVKK